MTPFDTTYFIGAADHTGLVKIGRTSGAVGLRLRALQLGSPILLSVWGMIGRDCEHDLHVDHADRRRHGEWFDLSYRAVRFAVACDAVEIRVKGAL